MAKLERIVILSVTAGTGHMRAALAIESAILENHPQAEVTVLDTFRFTSPLLEKAVLGSYMEMLKLVPVFYGYLYRQAERGQPLSGFVKNEFNRLIHKFSANKLMQFLKEKDPQVIICTHPFPLGLLSFQRRQGRLPALSIGVLTDFTVHAYWVFPEVDGYMVASESLVDDFSYYGIPASKVFATGIPIDVRFSQSMDKKKTRLALGLAPTLPTVLLMGGGLGMGPLAKAVEILGNGSNPCQLLVVAGKNQQLYQKIERLSQGLRNPVLQYGFVDNVDELMTAADLLVGKAGGLTCAEALAQGLPLCVYDPLPGQEERNAEFLSQAGVAVQVDTEKDLVAQVNRMLQDPGYLATASAAAKKLAKPNAARDIANLLETLLLNFSCQSLGHIGV